MPSPKPAREPVQVYMDSADKALLDELAAETQLSRAELLRRGLRRVAADIRGQRAPGGSLDELIGALDNATDVPTDLAARHDDYLYPAPNEPAADRD